MDPPGPHLHVGSEIALAPDEQCQQAPAQAPAGFPGPLEPSRNRSHLPHNQWVTRFLILEAPCISAGKWVCHSGEGRARLGMPEASQQKGSSWSIMSPFRPVPPPPRIPPTSSSNPEDGAALLGVSDTPSKCPNSKIRAAYFCTNSDTCQIGLHLLAKSSFSHP